MRNLHFYKSLMESISNSLKESLNDIEFNGTKLQYDEKTGKYRRIILDDDIDVSINYRKKPISNTVIIDPIQQIIYDLGTKEKIIDFFKKEKQKIIDSNGKYAQDFINTVSEIANALNINVSSFSAYGSKCFKIYTGYNGFSYKTEDEWYIIPEGTSYKMGYYYNYKKDLVKTYKAGINLLLHYEKIGYDSGLLKEPQYKYEILYDEDIDKALLKIVNNKTYENWVSSIINDFLNARVDYLKEHNLFNNQKAKKLYVKYGVDKTPENWFEWASKYLPLYINADMPFKSMSGWSGGVCNFYKNENGIYTVSTYVTNSNSDGAGKDIALSKFVQDSDLYYKRDESYTCYITKNDKIKIFKNIFDTAINQIDLGNLN